MSIPQISPDQAQEMLRSNAATVYLDVRTPDEFAQGHVPGAVNVPVAVAEPSGYQPCPDFVAECEVRFAKDTPIITGCLRGGRSIRAAGVLIAEGYTDVVDMRGGLEGELGPTGKISFPGWAPRGFPVE